MKDIRFYVIGGQYAPFNHGGSTTLLGAKKLAKQCVEYWDNWHRRHIPSIYAAEDCEKKTNFFGEAMLPKLGANPIVFWNGVKWQEYNNNMLDNN